MKWYDADHDYINDYIDQWNRSAGRAKTGMIILGILLALSGFAALAAPLSTYAFVQGVISIVLIMHGVGQIATYVQTPEFFRNGAQLAAGILNAILALLLFMLPTSVLAGSIIYLLAFMLIMTGVERISFARQMRYYQIPTSSMGTATGVLNIILGIAFIFMPLISSVVLSYLIAAYLIVAGITLTVEGIAIKRIDR